METEKHNVPPDPTRLIEGLRDTGYSFNTAIADLIDNSIAAEARNIKISIEMDYAGFIRILIADDGIGMSKTDLLNAMKYGSPSRANPRSLGKFGLGLKTASTAFCKKLSVISKNKGESALLKATWDLNHVAAVSAWELLLNTPSDEEIAFFNKLASNHSGTLVVWENVDRLITKKYTDSSGSFAQKALKKYIASLEEHVAMVYQRFLDISDPREAQKVNIWINNNKIAHWDPFCEFMLTPEQDEVVPVEEEFGEQTLGSFTVRAFILPRKEELSSEQEPKAKLNNDRQGFYIYRENRLIHHADWLGMYSIEPHMSLLRIEFSFTTDLDEAFQVDIKKSKIALNNELYRWLKDEFLPPIRREANDRYRKGQKKQITGQTLAAHDQSNRNIESKIDGISQAEVKVIDAENGNVQVSNDEGVTNIRIKVDLTPNKPGEFFVQPVESIDDGLLWTPTLIQGKQAVQINMGHSYYRKVYVPNILSNTTPVGTIQGMDALLWALAVAEFKVLSPDSRAHFDDLRFEVSKILRKLVESLPEPPEREDDN